MIILGADFGTRVVHDTPCCLVACSAYRGCRFVICVCVSCFLLSWKCYLEESSPPRKMKRLMALRIMFISATRNEGPSQFSIHTMLPSLLEQGLYAQGKSYMKAHEWCWADRDPTERQALKHRILSLQLQTEYVPACADLKSCKNTQGLRSKAVPEYSRRVGQPAVV